MAYPKRELTRRVLPVVTFVLISCFLGGKLVCARPQQNSIATSDTSSSGSSELEEAASEKTNPVSVTTDHDRNDDANASEARPANDAKPAHISSADLIRPVTGTPIKFYAEYSVNSGLDFGRAVAESSTKTATTMNMLKSGAKQPTPGATDMLVADIRTPPKIKSQIVHSQLQSLLTPGKGEAIPVVLEGNDEAALEKISSDNFKYTHSDATPTGGLSTWILLNSDAVSTPFSHKKVHKPVLYDVSNLTTTENTTDSKKKSKPASTTTENAIKSKIDAVVMKKPERKPIATIQKVNQTHVKKPTTTSPKIDPEIIQTTTGVTLQDSKFKNKTPVIMGKVPVTSPKAEVNTTTPMTFVESPADNGTRLGTPVVTFPHVPVRQRPNSASSTRKPTTATSTSGRPTLQLVSNGLPSRISSSPIEYSALSTTTVSTESASIAAIEETTPAITTETATKKTSPSGGKKKRKKNKKKNKRRRPGKKPAKIQSKISEDDNSTSKLPGPGLPPNRPLSTRIYNYLAREVMPNVGVGIVGLMLTAGLAGLLLYPFGAPVPIRRNYEKPNHPPYNLNDYPPVGEVDNAQPEESVLSQVLAGMSNTMNQYSREQPDVLYKTHPKYKPARFDNPNTFIHHKDVKFTTERTSDDVIKYSELGDVVSGPHESVKFTSFDINDSIKYPMENSQPSPGYSTIDLTTSSQNEPIAYHKYPGEQPDPVKPESVYSTLGEYASFNNPSDLLQNPVYNGEGYDYKNHKNEQDTQEFKVSSELEVVTQIPENQTMSSTTAKTTKLEQPSFAALEGIPKNYRTLQTSIRFEEPASVLPMNEDFVPSDGVYATSVERGPRNQKLRRRKRNVSSENELDSELPEATEKPRETNSTTQSAVQFITTSRSAETTISAQSFATANSSEISNEILGFEEVKVDASTEPARTNGTAAVLPEMQQTNITYPSSSPRPKDEANGSNSSPCENCDLVNIEEHSPTTQPFSLSTLFRKILDFKLRLGLELIRATSDVIGKYLGSVQARMTEALRNIQRSAFRMSPDTKSRKVIKRRDKRHILLGSLV